jgi:type IV pilus assembly protein PilB
MTLLEALAKKNVINAKDILPIHDEAESSGVSVEEVLERRGVSPVAILRAKGEAAELPTRSIGAADEVPYSALEYIPEESARYYKFVPLGVKNGVLEVGIVDADNLEARDALNFISAKINLPYKIYLISPADFDKVIRVYKGLSGEVNQALTDLETEFNSIGGTGAEEDKVKQEVSEGGDEKAAPGKTAKSGYSLGVPTKPGSVKSGEVGKPTQESKIVEDAPVTKIVATILRYATEGAASDIHIEHMHSNVRVRFRVDGVLNTSLILPAAVHPVLVARVKILSSMRLDEKRKPQDGRFSAKIDGRKIDFRVSTFPTYYGEKVEMRILDQERGLKKVEDMGLTDDNLEMVKRAVKRPFGIILISGPTGSGKTTTLYSMLQLIDKEKNNVLSLEDPIEYNIDGVNQSQVRPEIGYTFANGLRTTLRQDPNIILVGEIRDKETAQLAIQAALTGHLVLSTIHTNNATGIIPRLIDMGVDPYLIAPTLILGVAQRLVGRLPEGGGKDVAVEDSIRLIIERQFADLPDKFRSKINIPATIKEIDPTPESPMGTRGRLAVFEMFEMDKEVEQTILSHGDELAVAKVLRARGMLSMKEDAMIKAFKGLVPFEEVNKL